MKGASETQPSRKRVYIARCLAALLIILEVRFTGLLKMFIYTDNNGLDSESLAHGVVWFGIMVTLFVWMLRPRKTSPPHKLEIVALSCLLVVSLSYTAGCGHSTPVELTYSPNKNEINVKNYKTSRDLDCVLKVKNKQSGLSAKYEFQLEKKAEETIGVNDCRWLFKPGDIVRVRAKRHLFSKRFIIPENDD